MVIDSSPLVHKPGEIAGHPGSAPNHRSRHPRRGGRHWKQGPRSSYPRESNSDALNVFTRFFCAEAQVISAAISSSSVTPPTVVHTPSTPGDQGSDVLDIISAVEQEDLGLTLPPPKMTEAELFGRAVVFGLLVINVLTLLVLLAAFGSMGVHSDTTR
ncbi:hypothetical protein DFH29DRAFT_879344 [Suillus ampliporus]|nr:hypothetical protein DFH29DRAFT_879344 [Suillus ampliporus]